MNSLRTESRKDFDSIIQKSYYTESATKYDAMHLESDVEHSLALHLLVGYIHYFQIKSVLDIGAGTGRTITWLKCRFPELIIKGVEPVEALREQAYKKGVQKEDLVDGNGYELPFPDNSFDLVCEFAVLHHVRYPNRMISEMNRVASKAVGISDCNFIGQGILPLRLLKLALFATGLWPVANWFKTKGTGYTISEGDGLAYSYSVYYAERELKRKWKLLRMTTTKGRADSYFAPILTAEQIFVFATESSHT